MRLRTRLALALVGVALVLSTTALVGFTLYREAVVSQERDELERTSESVAAQVGVLLEERSRTVELWAQNDALRADRSAAERSALRSFVRSTSFSGVSVIDANGTMTGLSATGLTRNEERTLIGQSFGDRTYFQRAMQGQTYISEPVAAESGFRIVTISTPVYRNGRIVATLNAAFHLTTSDTFGSVRAVTGPAQRVRIFDDGMVIYDTANGSSVGESALVVNATVAGTDWLVSVTQSRAAIESRLQTITVLQGGAFLIILLSMTAFGGWLYREYLGNFARLHEGFSALADGEYGTTLELSGPTEWEEVRDHFNEVSETLGRRRTEVTVLNRVLRHNLRNAMTVVVGNADRISAETDDETVRAQAETIRRRGESLLDLADRARMVDASIQSERDTSPPRRVEAILTDVVTALREEFPDADVRLATETMAEIPNGALLEVAFEELARNAVVHSGAAPTVELTARNDEESVVVSISDDGPGLPAVERRLLTDTFVETPTEHGSGLGLWMVSWLVDRSGGDIDLAVDGGTTVTVTVPRADA